LPSLHQKTRIVTGTMRPGAGHAVVSAYPHCPFCDASALGAGALLEHCWRRHTGDEYRRTFGRELRPDDPVRWSELRRAEIEKAIEQRRRTLDVLAW